MKKIIYTLFAILFLTINISAQTSWYNQINPLNSSLGKIQFVSASEGWISASNGKLLHTTNSGNIWSAVTLDPVLQMFSMSDPDFSMCFINPSTGWVVRSIGTISNPNGVVLFRTTNGGLNWTKINISSWYFSFYVQFVDANTGWMIASNSTLTVFGFLHSTNGGNNWNAINSPPVLGVPFFKNSNTGWLMPVSNGQVTPTSDSIRKTTNGGLNWIAPWGTNAQVYFNSIYFSDENNGWAVGRGGIILKTTNGGTSWNYITNTGLTSSYISRTVFFLNANTGWIGTRQETTSPAYVLYTNNGGNSWTWQTPPTSNDPIYSIHFSDALNGGLTGPTILYGFICHTSNGGVWVKNISSEVPSSFSLSQNYPNPFNPVTKIKFAVPKNEFVKIKLFDMLGREIATLVNEKLQPGTYEVTWDGSRYPSGAYFYKLTAGDFKETKRMILIK